MIISEKHYSDIETLKLTENNGNNICPSTFTKNQEIDRKYLFDITTAIFLKMK